MKFWKAVIFFFLLQQPLHAQDENGFQPEHLLKTSTLRLFTNQPNISYEYRFAQHFGAEAGFGFYRPMPLANRVLYGMFVMKPFIECGPEMKLAFRYYPGNSDWKGLVLHGFVHGAFKYFHHQQIRYGGSSSYGYFSEESSEAYRLNTGLRIAYYWAANNGLDYECYIGGGYAWKNETRYIYSRDPDFSCSPAGCDTYPIVSDFSYQSFTFHLGVTIALQLNRS